MIVPVKTVNPVIRAKVWSLWVDTVGKRMGYSFSRMVSINNDWFAGHLDLYIDDIDLITVIS